MPRSTATRRMAPRGPSRTRWWTPQAQDLKLERQQWLRLLEDQLTDFREELNEKERRILDERLLADEPRTLQEIADRYGLTRERARQIEAKVIEKLRTRLKAHLGG